MGTSAGAADDPRRRVPGALLAVPARRRARATVAVCVAVVAALGVWFTHQTQAGWLDRAIDARIQAVLAGHSHAMNRIILLGDPVPVAAMTAALVLGWLAARNWRGAVLTVVAVPVAEGITEGLLKPLVHRTLAGNLSYPSGHTTGMFTLAAIVALLLAGPLRPRLRTAVRLLLTGAAFVVAGTVAVSMVGLGAHYFTDTVGGVCVATATVLTTAMLLDRIHRSRRRPAPGPEQDAAGPDEDAAAAAGDARRREEAGAGSGGRRPEAPGGANSGLLRLAGTDQARETA